MNWGRTSPRTGRTNIDVGACDAQESELLELAAELTATDLATLTAIVRRTAEIFECEGEDAAISALMEVRAILTERKLDA